MPLVTSCVTGKDSKIFDYEGTPGVGSLLFGKDDGGLCLATGERPTNVFLDFEG